MSKFDIISLYPEGEPEFMIPAWLGCISWAVGTQEVRERFEAETGLKWVPPKNGLEAMMDETSGWTEEYLKRFISWVTETFWGRVNDAQECA